MKILADSLWGNTLVALAVCVLIATMSRAALRARRPGVNPRCEWALVSLIAGLLIGLVSCLVHLKWQCLEDEIIWLIFASMFGLPLLSLMLAIVGLREMTLRPDRYRRGRSVGWASVAGALALPSLCIGLIFAAFDALRFEQNGLQFEILERPWVRIDSSDLPTDALLGFRHQSRYACIYVWAQPFHPDAPTSTAEYLDSYLEEVFDHKAEVDIGMAQPH